MKDKQNLPQLIALGALVLVCLGYVVFKVTGKKPATPAPQTQAKKTTTPAPETQDQAAVPTEGTVVVTVPAANPIAQVRRDPFAPTMDISTRQPGQCAPSYRPSMMVMRPTVPPLLNFNLRDRLPQVTPVGAGASRSSDSSDSEQSQPRQAPLPQFVLTGIITGRTNVAIIRLGEGRYIAKEGQIINGVYKVVSVSQDGVLLSHDGRAFFLKLGGEGNAS